MQRWTQDTAAGEPRALSAASPGMVVVAGAEATVAYDQHGARQWRLARPFIDARTLPDGRTILRTAEQVRIVDFLGETLTSWSTAGRWAPQPFADGQLIDLDDTGVLTCSASNGDLEWKAELGVRPLAPPTIEGRAVVVADATGLRLYDERGERRFRAEIGGAPKKPGTPFAAAEGAILPLASGFVAPVRYAAEGSGWYLWYPEHGEVEAFAAGAALAGPATTSGELFVAASPDFSDTGKQYVRAFTPQGTRAWELAVSRVVAIVALPEGRVAVVSSPTIDRWENYRALHPVEDECRVTVVDRRGAVSKVHVAQAPLAGVAAYAGGLLYVVKQGALVALAVE